MRVSKNFTTEELACPCCNKFYMTDDFIKKLQRLRDLYGKPMKVNSACRCESHNKKVGGVINSFHLITDIKPGTAVDVDIRNSSDRYVFLKCAINSGFSGIGIYKSFIHIDDRPSGRVTWVG